ncbi:Hypothetical protein mma_3028 [Janthinobacterium sp. Marseille]|uniref:site-specific DNA-methyltransferase (adenine-specific) n=1 Tax=Herminiimonas aquatilis TaxID=345342 RepID=A0ABW2J6U1_9BURK|nr:N-6 DNA methylase [Janthinobacterium sp. Marseille]ABR91873.1 Hypothetical protein mma_3028 [Janthinobacterium sp. Marseille]MBX9798567.1 N-6 DNA methylase [Burkholderiaceae bacterium]
MQWSKDSARGNPDAGQFATPDWIADILCSRLSSGLKSVADLGVGKGALSLALRNRVLDCSIVGIDKHLLPDGDQETMQAQGIHLITKDIGRPKFSDWFLKQYGAVSTVISNPPFINVLNSPLIDSVLAKNSLGNRGAKVQRLDLIFLAHAMKMITQQGEIAFILPRSAFATASSRTWLQSMIHNFGLAEIIALPSNAYHEAEVETAILIFRPGMRRAGKINVTLFRAEGKSKIDRIGNFSPAVLVAELSGLRTITPNSKAKTLLGLGTSVARGRYSSNSLASNGIPHFHTTSFQAYPSSQIRFDDTAAADDTHGAAQEGDILIARVGTRCLGRAAFVLGGKQQISDCVYRITAPAVNRHQIWEFLSSEEGRTWQRSLARGACAKFITQQDLLAAPLPRSITMS